MPCRLHVLILNKIQLVPDWALLFRELNCQIVCVLNDFYFYVEMRWGPQTIV